MGEREDERGLEPEGKGVSAAAIKLDRRTFVEAVTKAALPMLAMLGWAGYGSLFAKSSQARPAPDDEVPGEPTQCRLTCEGGCRGCEGTCTSVCSNDCSLSCRELCRGVCKDDCSTSCKDLCRLTCEGACKYDCEGGCNKTCEEGCKGSCGGKCSNSAW